MELRQFSNLIFKLSGLFIIYGLLFKYTIGAVFDINKSSISDSPFGGYSLNWNIVFISILCFVILIKNSNFLTYLFYRKNYVVELNEVNQYRILKVIFITFIFFQFITNLLIPRGEISFWSVLFSNNPIILFVLILFHRIIIKFMIKQINSYSEKQSNHIFIFSMISILLYFYFFWDYGFVSINPFQFTFRIIILLITLNSPFVFRLLLEKDISIKNNHFIFILFFWTLFLYNSQEFLLKLPNYERDNTYLVRDLSLHMILPLFLLVLHSFFAKIKSVSALQFTCIIIGILSIFCFILKYLHGYQYATKVYLISGIIAIALSTRTGILDKKLAKLKFTNRVRSVEPSLQTSSSFLFIALIFLTVSKPIIMLFDYNSSFTIDELASFSIVIIQLVIILIIISKKNLKLDNVDSFINTSLTFFLILIFCNNYLFFLSRLLFYRNHTFFNVSTIDIIYFIVLIMAILFSSYLAKLIKIILPKGYFKSFSN
ncbi:hypothetical protein [Flavobacterium humidisoli]|uniref:Uncharacterized protein n=1 Tax=Flavobacterium humidisoli TaxID=2937442 RepID=A0ABY4LL12_9FLAO|nr:hypothetical protein [Flavobacterium humidisoli]UPZ13680.1 hypothetical protein M0M44_13070 [Flavobacterium humidisoli]